MQHNEKLHMASCRATSLLTSCSPILPFAKGHPWPFLCMRFVKQPFLLPPASFRSLRRQLAVFRSSQWSRQASSVPLTIGHIATFEKPASSLFPQTNRLITSNPAYSVHRVRTTSRRNGLDKLHRASPRPVRAPSAPTSGRPGTHKPRSQQPSLNFHPNR